MSTFKIEITSVPDRNKLVAEIWLDDSLIAEINQEKGEFEIELYSVQNKVFKFDEFLAALEAGKKKLRG